MTFHQNGHLRVLIVFREMVQMFGMRAKKKFTTIGRTPTNIVRTYHFVFTLIVRCHAFDVDFLNRLKKSESIHLQHIKPVQPLSRAFDIQPNVRCVVMAVTIHEITVALFIRTKYIHWMQ